MGDLSARTGQRARSVLLSALQTIVAWLKRLGDGSKGGSGRLAITLSQVPGKAARGLWAFLGRCGLALKQLLILFIVRPLTIIGRPFVVAGRSLWAFLGRSGLALRQLLTRFIWRPLWALSFPLRWLYARLLRKPLRFMALSLGTAGQWFLVDVLGRFARRMRRLAHRGWKWLMALPETVGRRLPHRRARVRERMDLYGRRTARSGARIRGLEWAGESELGRAHFRVNRFTTAVLTTGVILLLGYLTSQSSRTLNVMARNPEPTSSVPALAALLPKMTLTPTVTPSPTATPTPTATPVAVNGLEPWPTPDPLGSGGSVAFSLRQNGNGDIYALTIGRSEPVRLTAHPGEDRDPAWSPDGRRLAFASNRDGNYEIYILDLATAQLQRLTDDLAFDGGPSWSPDGRWLVFESNRMGSLDLFIVDAAAENPPIRITENPAHDFSPAWSPDGRHIAYVSWRSGNKDLFLLDLDTASDEFAANISNSPDTFEDHPSWEPAGRYLAYFDDGDGLELVYALPLADFRPAGEPISVGRGRHPSWAPAGDSLAYIYQTEERGYIVAGTIDAWSLAPQAFAWDGHLEDLTWSAAALPRGVEERLPVVADSGQPLFSEDLDPPQEIGASYLLRELLIDAPAPYLSDKVDDSFMALRERVLADAGWDFLGALDNMFSFLDARPFPGEDELSWSKAARAFDFYHRYPISLDPQVEVVREDVGAETYWRVYLRVANQDGGHGEPLRDRPWDFTARYDSDPRYYDQGGKPKDAIPGGYYIDFTTLAADYGWNRVPALDNWRTFFQGIRYWHFENRQGLTWREAILELYTAAELEQVFGES